MGKTMHPQEHILQKIGGYFRIVGNCKRGTIDHLAMTVE
jgi:hypothetical protein